MVDFLGIGVQKGGTTWLYHQLSRHSQVAFPGGKEVHFWDRADAGFIDQWLQLLAPPLRTDAAGQPIRVRSGEITPAYASLPGESIRALHAACPDIRLFISFRNPLERAWSAALMALVRAQMHANEASDQWFIDHFRSAASRRACDYTAIMERWLAVFPQEQLMHLLFDDIETRPVGVLEAIANHLAIDPTEFRSYSNIQLGKRIVPLIKADQAYKQQPYLTPRPSLVPVLREMYFPEVNRISKLLSCDLNHWLDGFGASAAQPPQPRHEIGVGGRGGLAVEKWLAEGEGAAPPLAAPTPIALATAEDPQG